MKFSTIQKGFAIAFLLIIGISFHVAAQCYQEKSASGLPTLLYPLEGGQSSFTTQGFFTFNSSWTPGACGGKNKRHNGWDIKKVSGSIVGTRVLAAYDGTIKAIYSAGTGWANGITIEHSDLNGEKFTTNYTHVDALSGVTSGQTVRVGQAIATVADIDIDHLHFSVRKAAYSNTANRGALPDPTVSSTCTCSSDPAFPEFFVNPSNIVFGQPIDVRLSSNMTVSPNPIIQGGSLTASVGIKNFATTAFSGQIALAWHDNAGNFIADIQAPSTVTLAANGSQTLQFSKSPMTSNAGAYKLFLKYKANNSATWVTMPGGNNPLSINLIQLINLMLSPTTLNPFTANGGSAVVNVNTNAAVWLVTSNVSWARGAKVGSTVVVTVDPNTASTRSGIITVSSGTLSRQIAVNQAAYVPPIPANDNACGAYSASVNTSFSANTAGATTSPNAPTSCFLGTGKDVWFRFVATTTAATITATNGATIALYNGSCSLPAGIACASNKLVKTGLTRNSTYYIRVWLPNGSTGTIGMGLSSTANVTGGGSNTEGGAAMAQKLTFGNLTVAPNPVSNELSFSFVSDIETEATYQLLTLSGQMVWSQKATLQKNKNTQSVDVSAFPNGFYALRVVTEQREMLTQQVSVTH